LSAIVETNCLWHCDSGHEINCESEFDEEKNVVFVRKGDVNGEDELLFVISVSFVRFDCLVLILLRSFRSSDPEESVLDDICWNELLCEHRLFPPAFVRFERLVLLLLRGS